MQRRTLRRVLSAVALAAAALALVFYQPAKAAVAAVGLPPQLVLAFIVIVAIVLVVRH